jgi:hypothetical protein
MNGSQPQGQDDPTARAQAERDAERHLAALTGMTPEAARAFLAFHYGRHALRPAEERDAA